MTGIFRAKTSLALAASAFALLGIAAPASADTEMFSYTIAPQSAPYTVNFMLPSFDPAMGTLTGATIVTTASGTATLTVVNTNTTATPFTNGQASFPFTVTGPAGTTQTMTSSTGLISGTATAAPAPGAFSFTNFPGNTVTGTTSTAVATGSLAAYAAPGGVPANFTAAIGSGSYTGSGGSGLFFGGSGMIGGVVTITYSYTPGTASVPEPASLAMVALGLGGVAGVNRLRNRRRAA